jgi:hypothetical protein
MTAGYLKTPFLQKHIICLVFILPLLVSGCASVSTVIEKTKEVNVPFISSDSILKKKVGMIHIESDHGVRGDGISRLLEDQVAVYLSTKCNDILLVSAKDAHAPGFLSKPWMKDDSDDLDNRLMAETGRENGFNALVVAKIADVIVEEKRSGFIWFKDRRETARIRIQVDVYGTRTGAKILFESVVRDIEIEPGEKQLIEEGYFSKVERSTETVSDMAKTAGKKICKSMAEEPWKGFIVAVEDKKAVISSGSDVGIKVGDLFEVKDVQGVVEGPGGIRYQIPGTMIDEIEITAVSPGRSMGVSVSGKAVEVGNTIQVRQK